MKKIFLIIAIFFSFMTISAQEVTPKVEHVTPFSHVDGGMTFGTTGIGFEVSAPLSRSWDVRAGFDFMPHFKYDMSFNVTVGDGEAGTVESQSRFNKMAATLKDLTGFVVDDKVVMEGRPKYYNFRLLVDFKPLHDKRWHVTAGFYWGNSKIATAENAKEDMTSLFSVGLYNHLYEKAYNDEPIGTVDGNDVYLPTEVANKIVEYGRMGVHVGTYKRDITDAEGNIIHKAGDTYNMEPDENSMIKAYAKVNSFKPYLGIGFMGALSKKDPRWKIGFDAGALFWGGTPELKTHDGTDLINDVTDLRHGVKSYVNLVKAMKVMPVLNLRITRTIGK